MVLGISEKVSVGLEGAFAEADAWWWSGVALKTEYVFLSASLREWKRDCRVFSSVVL